MIQHRSRLQTTVHLLGLALVPILTLVFAWRDRTFDYDGGADKRYDEFASNADLLVSQGLSFFAAQVALVPAALAFVWLVAGRGRTLVLLGSGLYILSALGHAAFSGSQLMLYHMVSADNDGVMRKAFVEFDSSGSFAAVAAPGLIGLVLGSLLLGIGIIRSAELPPWIGWAFIAFLGAEFALGAFTEWSTIIASIFWAVAFWGTAAHVWPRRTQPDTVPAT